MNFSSYKQLFPLHKFVFKNRRKYSIGLIQFIIRPIKHFSLVSLKDHHHHHEEPTAWISMILYLQQKHFQEKHFVMRHKASVRVLGKEKERLCFPKEP